MGWLLRETTATNENNVARALLYLIECGEEREKLTKVIYKTTVTPPFSDDEADVGKEHPIIGSFAN